MHKKGSAIFCTENGSAVTVVTNLTSESNAEYKNTVPRLGMYWKICPLRQFAP